MLDSPASIAVAGVCALGGILVAIFQIMCHLRNYTEPVFQRYIIRLIFMVPVYAVGSWFSLKYRAAAIYFDTIRDCYEAWIIYNFTSLLLAYVGGPGAVVVKAEGKIVHPSWTHLTCCLPPMQVDGFFLRRCKQGTLQFVLLKPVMAALTLILYAGGAYTDGDMSPRDGYFYISILYNVCYTFALYGLMLFWIGAAELLEPFSPLLKFVLVKTVVFLTFWQGIAISVINSTGHLRDPEDGKALQNFLICVEMLIAGGAMTAAFPHRQYALGGTTAGFRLDAFWHAVSVRDVVADVVHVFAPSYSDYVLYSDGGPADNVKRKKYRGQTGGAAGGDGPAARRGRGRGGVQSIMDKSARGGGAGGGGGGGEGGGDGGGAEGGGRRSKTPQRSASKAERAMERNRNTAILVDSESDAMDSEEDGGGELGTGVASDSDSEGGGGGGGGGGQPARGAGAAAGAAEAAVAALAGGRLRRKMKLLSSSDEEEASEAAARAAKGSERGEAQREAAAAAAAAAAPAQQPAPQRRLQGPLTPPPPAVLQPPGRASPALAPLRAAARAIQQQEPPGDAREDGGGGGITLPRPRSVAEHIAAVKAAAASGVSPRSPAAAAWAASGWGDDEAAGGGGAAKGAGAEAKKGNGSGWAEEGWSNVPM
ncbi:hypothetical protein Rsub_03623 [Raphidocelis subcapitata]|uniref:Uncharacterized protein n=1 Tax=Raphidocelis subcapitata TaxID=307507 RepID=A0A2V0P0D0_9CHLO|nr:hypothetical protein Rsub_03623 [Raphidocelis subcapitata]|eukprot:GBF91303.1 hypothetical protein Rsub_03623 [Raphidocelis subcapitata]